MINVVAVLTVLLCIAVLIVFGRTPKHEWPAPMVCLIFAVLCAVASVLCLLASGPLLALPWALLVPTWLVMAKRKRHTPEND